MPRRNSLVLDKIAWAAAESRMIQPRRLWFSVDRNVGFDFRTLACRIVPTVYAHVLGPSLSDTSIYPSVQNVHRQFHPRRPADTEMPSDWTKVGTELGGCS